MNENQVSHRLRQAEERLQEIMIHEKAPKAKQLALEVRTLRKESEEPLENKMDSAEQTIITTAKELLADFPTTTNEAERLATWGRKRFYSSLKDWADAKRRINTCRGVKSE